jgi:LPXTG-motif cell wall-anchored protein
MRSSARVLRHDGHPGGTVNKWIARAAVAALVGLTAARAEAQITTVIAAPKRVEAKAQANARREEAAQDSIARVTLTGMKQWVDSAANALALRPDTGTSPVESPTTPTAPAPPQKADSAAARTPATAPAVPPGGFRDGARAPNTATQVPVVALVGGLMVLAGLVLRRRRPLTARATRR